MREKRRSILTKIIILSVTTYAVFMAVALVIWNIGIPWLGIPGRIPELIRMEEEHLQLSLADRTSRFEIWRSERMTEAYGITEILSLNPLLSVLSEETLTEPELGRIRREASAVLTSFLQSSRAISRITVVKKENGRYLAGTDWDLGDGYYANLGITGRAEPGQFLEGGDLCSYRSSLSMAGIPIVFLFESPITAILEDHNGRSYDKTRSIAVSITDSEGILLTPLYIPDNGSLLRAGRKPLTTATLERISLNAEPETVRIGSEPAFVGVSRLVIPPAGKVFLLAAILKKETIRAILRESITMTIIALLITTTLSLVTILSVRAVLSPINRLYKAVEAFGRSEPYVIPKAANKETGEIINAFTEMTRKVKDWKNELEVEVERRTRMLRAIADLSRIFARDTSEKATVFAAAVLKEAFGADAAAIFYVDAKREYRYCVAGTEYPIVLTQERWRECVGPVLDKQETTRFGPWAPPGITPMLPLWMSHRLYSSGSTSGYIFLGRSEEPWSHEEEADIGGIADSIAPIIQVRKEREKKELERQEAEKRLSGEERRLRTFLEGSRDTIYMADATDLITEINAAGIDLLGISDKEDALGKSFSSFAVNPHDRQVLLERVSEFGYVADYELLLKRTDGSNVFCLETSYAIRDADGRIIEMQGIIKDITERIQTEKSLWKMNLELAEANLKIKRTQALLVQSEKLASIGQLAAGIAHEINNPLGFLKSNHEMFGKYMKRIREAGGGKETAATARLFEEIDTMFDESTEGFARIVHIIGSLKSFSRVEQGSGFGMYNVNEGVESTLVIARNEIKYVADVIKELGDVPPIRARSGEINQVILNLLVNAAQAIQEQKRPEKGIIEVRTYVSGEYVVIEIHDDGPGIPESLHLKIFDPFYTTKAPGKGTGLGLSISYDIVAVKHGGRINVRSEPGAGTTFTIELPINGPSEPADPERLDGDGKKTTRINQLNY